MQAESDPARARQQAFDSGWEKWSTVTTGQQELSEV